MGLKQYISNFTLIVGYLKSDIVKKQRSFKIGLLSIFLVVLFVCLLLNVTYISPIIFIRLAEQQSGETDIIAIPSTMKKDIGYRNNTKKNQTNNSSSFNNLNENNE
jgi:hypothetical protein